MVAAEDVAGPTFCSKMITTGCGVVTVNQNWGTHGWLATFDSKTGKLIGYGFFDDVPFEYGGCVNASFVGGTSQPKCPTATTRQLCTSSDNDGGEDAGG